MEKRLTAQGPNDRKSYTVTLPLDWVKQQGLDKTKTVDLEIIGNKVIISSDKEDQLVKFIDADKAENALTKLLQAAYRLGVDELKIKYSTPEFYCKFNLKFCQVFSKRKEAYLSVHPLNLVVEI